MKYGLLLAALLLVLAGYFLLLYVPSDSPVAPVVLPDVEEAPPEAGSRQVHEFCTTCHAYPQPETFPRALWRSEIRQAHDFFRGSSQRITPPDLERIVAYFEERAPVTLPLQTKAPAASDPFPVKLEQLGWSPSDRPPVSSVTHVQLAHLWRRDRLELLVCQSNPGRIWAVKLYDDPPSWHLLAEVQAPCHVEVVDLDKDGRNDLLVAELGSVSPTDDRTGRVVWLRGEAEGRFTKIPLLDGVGRVADVQAADFNGDGKLDLVVAVFGWRRGEVLLLENCTKDEVQPVFNRRVLDSRAGAIHVPIADINGDGHLDVVALFAQEHETVSAFLGDGKGGFTKKIVFEAPHPAYGSSGIQLVDLDRDGDIDVLYSNGDSLDPPSLLKPYHGVQWLENKGAFPFAHHPLGAQHGVMRALAADVDADGMLDIVSVAFLPPESFPTAKEHGAEAVQILRQVAPGKFERHVVDTGICRHFSIAAGDVFGDGRVHLVAGNFFMTPMHAHGELLTVWRNRGKR